MSTEGWSGPAPGARVAGLPVVFGAPSRYVQGRGAIRHVSRELARLNAREPWVVYDPRIDRVLRDLPPALDGAGRVAFGGECSDLEMCRLAKLVPGETDVVIGIGGGTTLDTAKSIAAARDLKLVLVPTAASTDAPTSALSVIYSDEGHLEGARLHRRHPDLVLVDTEIVIRGPVRLLVAGMVDALATWFEAHACATSRRANFLGGTSTRLALQIARFCYQETLGYGAAARIAAEAGALTPACERVVEANTLLSGLGFENVGVAAAHAIHNGLALTSAGKHFWHGEKVVVGLLAMLMLEGSTVEFEEVCAFSLEVGLPIGISDLGLSPGDGETLSLVATRACKETDTMHNLPFAVEPNDVVAALRAADAAARNLRTRPRRDADLPAPRRVGELP